MFLHLGNNFVIPIKDIIAIIDADSLMSKDTQDFFKIAEEEGFIKRLVEDGIKSYIITEKIETMKHTGEEVRKSIIYCSNISSTTLYKRADFIDGI